MTRVEREVAPGIKLSARIAGPEAGPLLVFLHGFPEAGFAWNRYVEHFASLGFRVLAPDQRGYGASSKPHAISAYRMDTLALDIVRLIESEGRKDAFIVGHDWGAAITWWLGMQHPEVVRKMVVMNVPHPLVMRSFLMRRPAQLLKSWYMFFFQLPWLPEQQFTTHAHRTWNSIKTKTARADTFGANDEDKYVDAWRTTGAARGMVNWYRAAMRQALEKPPTDVHIQPPTLMLWGTQDILLSEEMIDPSLQLCDQGRARRFKRATHWVLHEEFEAICEEMQRFLGSEAP